MKKIVITLAVLASFGFISSQALACYWDGYWDGSMYGGGYGNHNANHQRFFNDTAELRGAFAAKQAEYGALMAQKNPDPKRAAQISKEIASLHDQLEARAQAHNLPIPGSNNYRPQYNNRGWGGRGCW